MGSSESKTLAIQASPSKLRHRSALSRAISSAIIATTAVPATFIFQPVHAETINVDTSSTAIDGADGFCSITEAVQAANSDLAVNECPAGSGADIIALPSTSTFTFDGTTPAAFPGDGLNALPSITSEITIEGNSSTIERDSSGGNNFRLIHIASSGNLTINDSNVTGGQGFVFGGMVKAQYGGGIFNDGTLIMNRCTLSNSVASTNPTSGRGGGIFNNNNLIINRSEITGNFSRYGGGIANETGASVTLTDSTLSANTAGSQGGGMRTLGIANIVTSTVSGNSAQRGAGVYNGPAAALPGPPNLVVTNSTISENASSSQGGGIYNQSGYISLIHSTLAFNTNDSGFGQALRIASGGTRLENTLIAGHGVGGCSGFPNYWIGNSVTDSANCHYVVSGSTLSADAALISPLQDNGGPTKTHALLTGNPAIDAVPADACTPVSADQRGLSRPLDGDENTVSLCDTGSFETISDTDDDGIADAFDVQIMTSSNFCSSSEEIIGPLNVDATVQCSAFDSISTNGALIVETGGELLLHSKQIQFSPGFKIEDGGLLRATDYIDD